MPEISRRGVFAAILGVGAAGALATVELKPKPQLQGLSAIQAHESSFAWNGNIKSFELAARPATIDLGGKIAKTWVYGDSLPGKVIRVNKNDRVKVAFSNDLVKPTSVHWHGLAIRNDMDGVPGVTTPEVLPGQHFNFDFIVPESGTHWFHPHTGIQLDRGLYAPFIVDDPHEITNYEREWIVILDDWTDGVGQGPDQILADLMQGSGGSASTNGRGGMGMGMGGMGSMNGTDGGDVNYPMYLINGRPKNDPDSLQVRPGERVRIRIINAAADTIFHVALAQHTMSITHSDGFPVKTYDTTLLQIGMGERYDVVVTMGDGVFPLVAEPVGKSDIARALIRTASGGTPNENFRPSELNDTPLTSGSLQATDAVRLPNQRPDRDHNLVLTGSMNPYQWRINGRLYPDIKPLNVKTGEMNRFRIRNMSMMSHPIHLHGHTYQLGSAGGTGARKDTVLVPPMGGVNVDFLTENPGRWMVHCHNAYHAEAGMMTRMEYIK